MATRSGSALGRKCADPIPSPARSTIVNRRGLIAGVSRQGDHYGQARDLFFDRLTGPKIFAFPAGDRFMAGGIQGRMLIPGREEFPGQIGRKRSHAGQHARVVFAFGNRNTLFNMFHEVPRKLRPPQHALMTESAAIAVFRVLHRELPFETRKFDGT